ncbi:hypothetical protein BH20VER2_BH20VER2_03950 [soil metagenome]
MGRAVAQSCSWQSPPDKKNCGRVPPHPGRSPKRIRQPPLTWRATYVREKITDSAAACGGGRRSPPAQPPDHQRVGGGLRDGVCANQPVAGESRPDALDQNRSCEVVRIGACICPGATRKTGAVWSKAAGKVPPGWFNNRPTKKLLPITWVGEMFTVMNELVPAPATVPGAEARTTASVGLVIAPRRLRT